MRKEIRLRKFRNRRHKYTVLLEGREEDSVTKEFIAWWAKKLRKPHLWGIGSQEHEALIKAGESTETLEEIAESMGIQT